MIPLNRGQLKITAAKFYRVSGQSTQHQGVLPDVTFPELFNVDQIGESSLDDAMPWDMIQPAVYEQTNDLQPMLAELQRRHAARVADNVDFNYLRALSKKGKESALRTHVSLNETIRREEKAKDDLWRLDLENSLRAARGKTLADSMDHLDELVEAEAKEKEDANEPDTPDLEDQALADVHGNTASKADAEEIGVIEDNAMLEEAGKVLLDLIDLSRQIVQLESIQPSSVASSSAQTPLPNAEANSDG